MAGSPRCRRWFGTCRQNSPANLRRSHNMLSPIEAHKSIAEIQGGLEESAARHNFWILAVRDLRETMKK